MSDRFDDRRSPEAQAAPADGPDESDEEDAPPAAAWTEPASWGDPKGLATLPPWVGRPGSMNGSAPEPARRVVLSARDVEVLRLLAGGENTAGIAGKLAYSESMIKHVIHGVITNIGARNRAHAVAIAIRGGII